MTIGSSHLGLTKQHGNYKARHTGDISTPTGPVVSKKKFV